MHVHIYLRVFQLSEYFVYNMSLPTLTKDRKGPSEDVLRELKFLKDREGMRGGAEFKKI